MNYPRGTCGCVYPEIGCGWSHCDLHSNLVITILVTCELVIGHGGESAWLVAQQKLDKVTVLRLLGRLECYHDC